MTDRMRGITALSGLTALALLVANSSALAQESGAEVWAQACGRCHRAQPTTKYDADTWRAIVGQMALYARLTPDEETAVREFLMGAARRLSLESGPRSSELPLLASSDPRLLPIGERSAAEIYAKNCAPCHGKEGNGDGPAAAVMTPRPPDLTDSSRMDQLTDDELLAILTDGKGAMPGFGALLKPEELQGLVNYLRALAADSIP